MQHPEKWCLTKIACFAKKYPKIILNLLYDSDPWPSDFQNKFFQFASNCGGKFYWQGVGSTSESQ